ncbi:hypothetical protein DFH27DRAFT_574819 [Peziza echinospora]|nr:hypothetical protein DFH27DRAFT_574819 [Peziza echinospora]
MPIAPLRITASTTARGLGSLLRRASTGIAQTAKFVPEKSRGPLGRRFYSTPVTPPQDRPAPPTATTTTINPTTTTTTTNTKEPQGKARRKDDFRMAPQPPTPPTAPEDVTALNAHLTKLGFPPITAYPDSHPNTNPVDIFRCFIAEKLAAISGVSVDLIYPSLEWTNSFDKGDLLLAIPRLRIKGRVPADLAKEWAEAFPENEYTQPPVHTQTFLQFFFKPKALLSYLLPNILTKKEQYGRCPDLGKGKRVIVEFSSPNIAKPFHAGHLRSTIIGGFLSNLYEAVGWEVIRMNYLGDWGKQFGVLAVGFERYGSEAQLLEDPIHHLFDVYVRVNQDIRAEKEATATGKDADGKPTGGTSTTDNEAREFFARLEAGDAQARELWSRFRELSIKKYVATYSRLNITYDVYSGESQVGADTMAHASKLLEEKGLSSKDKGAVIVDLTPFNKKLGKAIVQKSDGTTLYLTRDIGAAMERYEKYKFDKMIYVVASQQDLHLQQLFTILDKLDLPWANRCMHINFGMVLGMSTRNGTVVFLDDILADTKESMHEVMKTNADKYAQVTNPEEVADVVGRTGVMIQDMSGKRINNYPFDMKRMTSFEGDTGPYLQYAHSRLCSITRKANIPEEDLLDIDVGILTGSTHAVNLARALAQWPDVVVNTLKTHEPTTVVTYLFKMTHLLSSGYDVLRVVGEEEGVARARLALYESARRVLGNGMRLLGLTPVERM